MTAPPVTPPSSRLMFLIGIGQFPAETAMMTPEDPHLECTANLQGPRSFRNTTRPLHHCLSQTLGTLSCAPAPDGAAEQMAGRNRCVCPRDLRSQTGTRIRPSTVKVLQELKTLR